MPVTMPGSAMGSTTRKLTASRPKNRWRCTASDVSVPSTSASRVAPVATFRLVSRAWRAPVLCAASLHQCSVKPSGGQANDFDVLNDRITTIDQRHVQEQEHGRGGEAQRPAGRGGVVHQRFSKAPVRRAPSR